MKRQDSVPFRAKVCTVIGGAIVILATVFSVYAGSPKCVIPNIDSPLWGLLVLIVYLLAGGIILWGWKGYLHRK